MKVLVCGSRDWTDREAIFAALRSFDQKTLHIITGGRCKLDSQAPRGVSPEQVGADQIASLYVSIYGIECTVIEPDWDGWEKRGNRNRAGPERNSAMLDLCPDIVLAFKTGPVSKGTDDTIRKARQRDIPVEITYADETPTHGHLTVSSAVCPRCSRRGRPVDGAAVFAVCWACGTTFPLSFCSCNNRTTVLVEP